MSIKTTYKYNKIYKANMTIIIYDRVMDSIISKNNYKGVVIVIISINMKKI